MEAVARPADSQNAPVLLNDGSAKWRPGFGRVPGEEILQGLLVGALGVRGADRVDGEGGDGAPIPISRRDRGGKGVVRHAAPPARRLWFPETSRSWTATGRGGKSDYICHPRLSRPPGAGW
jgi:hypothetical protein